MIMFSGAIDSGGANSLRYPCSTSWSGRGNTFSGANRYVMAASISIACVEIFRYQRRLTEYPSIASFADSDGNESMSRGIANIVGPSMNIVDHLFRAILLAQ